MLAPVLLEVGEALGGPGVEGEDAVAGSQGMASGVSDVHDLRVGPLVQVVWKGACTVSQAICA